MWAGSPSALKAPEPLPALLFAVVQVGIPVMFLFLLLIMLASPAMVGFVAI